MKNKKGSIEPKSCRVEKLWMMIDGTCTAIKKWSTSPCSTIDDERRVHVPWSRMIDESTYRDQEWLTKYVPRSRVVNETRATIESDRRNMYHDREWSMEHVSWSRNPHAWSRSPCTTTVPLNDRATRLTLLTISWPRWPANLEPKFYPLKPKHWDLEPNFDSLGAKVS